MVFIALSESDGAGGAADRAACGDVDGRDCCTAARADRKLEGDSDRHDRPAAAHSSFRQAPYGQQQQQQRNYRQQQEEGEMAVVSPLTPRRSSLELRARLRWAATAGPLPHDPWTARRGAVTGTQVEGLASDPTLHFEPKPLPPSAAPGERDAAGGAAATAGGGAAGATAAAAAAEVTLFADAPVLGRGASGRVYEGLYRGARVAVKVMYDATDPWGGWAGREGGPSPSQPRSACGGGGAGECVEGGDESSELQCQLRQLVAEVAVLGRCDHPNVVRLLAVCLTPPRLCLVMERCETSLERVLHIAIQICQGLQYLHPTIVHRDLKPANVLINGAETELPVAKLADFGLSRISAVTLATLHPEAGTPAYIAPECYDVSNYNVTHHANNSVAAVAYRVALLGERLPLGQLPGRRCPPRLRALIQQCWEADPMRRPAAAEAVKELQLLQLELGMARGRRVPAAAGGGSRSSHGGGPHDLRGGPDPCAACANPLAQDGPPAAGAAGAAPQRGRPKAQSEALARGVARPAVGRTHSRHAQPPQAACVPPPDDGSGDSAVAPAGQTPVSPAWPAPLWRLPQPQTAGEQEADGQAGAGAEAGQRGATAAAAGTCQPPLPQPRFGHLPSSPDTGASGINRSNSSGDDGSQCGNGVPPYRYGDGILPCNGVMPFADLLPPALGPAAVAAAVTGRVPLPLPLPLGHTSSELLSESGLAAQLRDVVLEISANLGPDSGLDGGGPNGGPGGGAEPDAA
ncbi:hypothetical protein GPECTOR_95g695 [Gonium pectorale]|uniref:Protein kinase domain-containing protein n=1 Tax=Gonium pectorale TaxID=33097 RepID=A0A150G0A4_GONPE|nr:hypothetical protein GPECTOR_95g695 [Gonium pectorale]|eukprot:KXZ43306.1 hypothetical protein GPECTOR_95g695 [Gonium pectorale]